MIVSSTGPRDAGVLLVAGTPVPLDDFSLFATVSSDDSASGSAGTSLSSLPSCTTSSVLLYLRTMISLGLENRNRPCRMVIPSPKGVADADAGNPSASKEAVEGGAE